MLHNTCIAFDTSLGTHRPAGVSVAQPKMDQPDLRQRRPPGPPGGAPPPPRVARPVAAPAHQNSGLLSGAAAALAALLSAAAVVALLSTDGGAAADRGLPLALAVLVLALGSIMLRVAVSALVPAGGGRLRRATRHFTGERAAYARTSQTLAMMDRDFTAADYDMLLDLDNNSQRLRQFLEGASKETIDRMPSYTYKKKQVDVAEADDGESVSTALSDDLADIKPSSSGESGYGETARSCTICLEPFEDGMKIRILPCMHQFMAECLDPWLLQTAKCPVCKGNAVHGPDADEQFSSLTSS
jgi:Ring finger domain